VRSLGSNKQPGDGEQPAHDHLGMGSPLRRHPPRLVSALPQDAEFSTPRHTHTLSLSRSIMQKEKPRYVCACVTAATGVLLLYKKRVTLPETVPVAVAGPTA
jgi:hypothetical protein